MNNFPNEVLISNQIFGFFPLVCSTSAKGITSLVFSRKIHVSSLIIVSVITVMSYFALYSDYQGFRTGRPIRMKNVTNVLATVLDVIPLNIMMLTVFFSNYKKQHIFIRIYQLLGQIDQTLMIEKKSKMVKVIAIVGYTSSLLIFAANSMIRENVNFTVYIPFWLTYFIQTSIFLNFTCIMEIIENRFKILNKKIRLAVMSQHFNMDILLKDLGLSKDINSENGPHHDLKELMDCYSQLYEVVQLTDQFFNAQLFIAVVSSFIHNLITLYFFIAGFIDGEKLHEVLTQSIWVFTHAAHLIFLVWPCTSVANAAGETASMVCQLICKDLHPHLKSQLELFLLQLLHYRVQFSAVGFFNIDSHILTSIASSVTTYLVIMIQFRVAE